MKKIVFILGCYFVLNMNAHAADVACLDVNLVKNELNSELSELKDTLVRKLKLPSRRGMSVANIDGDIQVLTLHPTPAECQYKVDGVILFKYSRLLQTK